MRYAECESGQDHEEYKAKRDAIKNQKNNHKNYCHVENSTQLNRLYSLVALPLPEECQENSFHFANTCMRPAEAGFGLTAIFHPSSLQKETLVGVALSPLSL